VSTHSTNLRGLATDLAFVSVSGAARFLQYRPLRLNTPGRLVRRDASSQFILRRGRFVIRAREVEETV